MKEDYQNIEDSAPYLSIQQEPFIFETFEKSFDVTSISILVTDIFCMV